MANPKPIITNPKLSLVITGFMGTGKTSVGQIVARRLGREFVDMDAVIEAREGHTVRAIFETRGEEYFRALESEVCAELAARDNLVIATGGGALVNPRNHMLFANAFVVCLDATVDEILPRLDGMRDRPLLAGGETREHVETLLTARRKAYAQIERHVDTTGKSVEQVVGEILVAFESWDADENGNRSKSVENVKPILAQTADDVYPIYVSAGLSTRVGVLVAELNSANGFSSCCALITNPRVGNLYAARVIESLRANKFEPRVIEIPDGEIHKTLDTVRVIYDQLIDAQLDRRSIIFALGGGVVGDVAGFVAATYLRGVPFVQLPTTLLAMVDASIGGKVAVDHPRGKNLIGAFKPPRVVIADTDLLATLPDVEFRSGMAEVVKHAIIGDVGLFSSLESRNWRSEIGGWIERAMRVKVNIVARDPFDRGERAKLNLGHTFAHALEKLSDYELRHGDAVAIGLVCAARLAARRKMCDGGWVTRVEDLLRALELPTHVPREFSATAILDAMQTDKKRVAGRLRFVLPRALGDVVIVDDVAREDILVVIEETRE